MFDPNQQYPAPQMGGLGASSPIMAAMLQQYLQKQSQPQQSMPSTPGQTMGMIQGNSQNWNSSMPQQGLMQPQQPIGALSGQPIQVTNGN